jgi:hypothetical protein
MPVFSIPTYAISVEFVAAGLATGHVLISFWPNLSPVVRSRLKIFEIDATTRTRCWRCAELAPFFRLAGSGRERVFLICISPIVADPDGQLLRLLLEILLRKHAIARYPRNAEQ